MDDNERIRFLVNVGPSDGLYTATEAARRLHISPQLICQWRRSGKVKPVAKFGRSPVYRFSDLAAVECETRQDWIHSHRGRRGVASGQAEVRDGDADGGSPADARPVRSRPGVATDKAA